jgi:hypothetical protein
VILAEDAGQLAEAFLPAILRFALRATTSRGKKALETNAYALVDLKKVFVPALQDPIAEAVERRFARRALPRDVAWVLVKGKPVFFLAANLGPGPLPASTVSAGLAATAVSHRPAATVATAPARDFGEAFFEAFDRLDQGNGATNFVKLSEIRRALPQFNRETFDAGLRRLRLDLKVSLDPHEGLYGVLTDDDRAAGVMESGRLLVYASRR